MDQGMTSMLLWLAVMFAIFYFLMIRPNSKRQKERIAMLDAIKVRDNVITIGGIHGTVTRVNDETVMIKVAENVELEFLKSAVQTVENYDNKEESGKKKKIRLKKEVKNEESEE